ncbi:sugar ABC transporter ATP-binding protein [Leadbettera azotonutricia]|uniref:Ribose import ATP-binding protein RbsA n=1 Tax=Leadbettera azotonutricia (strain ATCC BAA-888 / DSM 13862 / ZAS-9) TaxID=545695 RepID=F5Y870_LEAAZ|nr:sugar ABC transporter ATP-binding protein [Leadbettera azotonutricia]AEF81932.1 ribose import ATP-binding protein RbsA [Leadbettera azotonutricia ZAS-9]
MILEMKSISKSFGPVNALKDVSFTVTPGEIHGLLGENGAGKTTLMNILAGTFSQDEGQIVIDGNAVHAMTPRKSNEMKIRFIHQELSLCNDLRVYQNMFLGAEYARAGFINKKDEIKRAQEVLDYMNTGIDATLPVAALETAKKQLIEIAHALLFKSELIIMDEPTTALNSHEIENLFVIMNQLKKEGVSFIYISHKMPEVFQICDKYTVLRDGAFIQSGNIKDIDEHQATELLIGKTFVATNLKEGQASQVHDEMVLKADRISGGTFEDISFELHRGEVIVITGLQGSGTDELATALFGASPIKSGIVSTARGKLETKSIKKVMQSGIAMVPRNRKERGIIPHLSIRQNNSLAYFVAKHKKLFVSQKEEHQRYMANKDKMDIRAGSDLDPVTSLSGGNQQKLILSKWLEIGADVYIMDNPTQGIDVGSKYAIYKLVNNMAKDGKAVLMFSTEFPEILQVADRCIVMYKGKINIVLERQDISEVNIMAHSTGATTEKQK